MKFVRPFYYDEFKCVADKCKDTCCKDWNIFIDKKTSKKYQQVKGEFGEKLNEYIRLGETDQFILDENKRCPFLNNEQLCEIYINLGEDYMCDICKGYPRMERKYNDVWERDLSLSCPEVARVLVTYKKPFDFLLSEIENSGEAAIEVDKVDLFNALIVGRGLSVDIIQMEEIAFWKRLYMCIIIADKIQDQINKGEVNQTKEIIRPFQNDEYILAFSKSLDEIKENTDMKLNHYYLTIKIIKGLKISDKTFLRYLIETTDFINSHAGKDLEEVFIALSHQFDLFEKDNKAFENYIVYYLFHYYIDANKEGNIKKYITIMVEAYSLMRLFAMVRWNNNGFRLSEEEMVEIFYSYSRFIEHGQTTMDDFYNQIKSNGLDNKAFLALLIR